MEIATARSFILNRGIVTDTISSHAPWSQDGVQCIPLHQGFCQPGQCPADGLAGLWGLTVKAQCLSACLPPRHPNSLWLSYRPFSVFHTYIWPACRHKSQLPQLQCIVSTVHCTVKPCIPWLKCFQLWFVSITCNDTCIAHCYYNNNDDGVVLYSVCFNSMCITAETTC